MKTELKARCAAFSFLILGCGGDPDAGEVGTLQQAVCVEQQLVAQSASASSVESASWPASAAIDGNLTGPARWSSAFSDPQWLSVDFGARRYISRVVLNWETAASSNYRLEVSDASAGPWTTIYSDPAGNGGTDTITGLSAQGRFLRMYSLARTTGYGNSLFEIRAYGDTNPSCGTSSPVCGDGACNGTETCTSCSGDCGACPPPSPVCGDGACNGTETCTSCSGDCGACPATPAKLALTHVSNSGGWSNVAGLTDGNLTAKVTSGTHPNCITYNLGGTKKITSARLLEDNAGSAHVDNWKVQHGTTATGPWLDAFPYTNTPSAMPTWNTFDFPDVSGATYVRVCLDNDGTVEAAELEVWGVAGTGCTTNAQCSDNNACNGTETCQSGTCRSGTALTCNDNNACTTDSCNVATGCQFSNNTNPCTDDGNSCTTDVCSAGACTHPSNGTCSSGCNVPGNLIANCDFNQGLAGYPSAIFLDSGAGSQTVSAGQLQVQITNGGTAAWNVQPRRENLGLAAGKQYQASFRARASAARPLHVSITQNQAPYTSYSGTQIFNLTTSMQTFSFTFAMGATSDPNVKFEIRAGSWDTAHNGQALPSVFLDDLYLAMTSPDPDRPSNISCFAGDAPGGTLALQEYWPAVNLLEPLDIVQKPVAAGDDFIVVEKHGRMLRLLNNPTDATERVFFNTATGRPLETGEESGNAALAFHPNFGVAGQTGQRSVYITYIVRHPAPVPPENAAYELRLSRFQTTTDYNTVDSASEQILVRVNKESRIHGAGALAFGPDGLLYMSVGDDGNNLPGDNNPAKANDPSTPYGKILRLNPNQAAPATYEVVARGLRNPWRISFDGPKLWIGNVGFDKIEEVNVLDTSHANAAQGGLGAHFGWPYCEGNLCCAEGINCGGLPPQPTNLVFPTHDYPRSMGPSGEGAVIGGFVYRGSSLPSLVGKYIFADFVDQVIYAYDPVSGQTNPLMNTVGPIDDFGVDRTGELYFVTKGADAAPTGGAFKIVLGQPGPANWPPPDLLDWGCFETLGNAPVPLPGVIPYGIAQSFWSDGATKQRFFAIPDGTVIDVSDPNEWKLPLGAVTIKNFYNNGLIFETRLFVRHNDGSYAGYTYEWTGSNVATLVPAAGVSRNLGGGLIWDYPSRAQCMTCHTAASAGSLGLETRQLNINFNYPGIGAQNQLSRLGGAGWSILGTSSPALLSPFPAIDNTGASLSSRAQSYLHVNCSNCHRGPTQSDAGRSSWDARFSTTFGSKGLCNVQPLVAVSGNSIERLVRPGDSAFSTVWLRMNQRQNLFMPPLGSDIADAAGSSLIAQWIGGMTGCPLGRVEAEAYNRSFDLSAGNAGPDGGVCDRAGDVDIEPTADQNGGVCNLGWVQASEWIEFDVNVPAAGTFDIAVRLASSTTGKSVRLIVDGVSSPLLPAPSGGWQSWGDAVWANRTLTAGNHVVRLHMETGDTNVNYIEFRQLN